MRDRAVLDTGVIVAIYFDEDASERAVEVASKHSPITLDLAVAEVGNAAWKRVAFFGESKDATWKSLYKCLEFIKSCREGESAIIYAGQKNVRESECKKRCSDGLRCGPHQTASNLRCCPAFRSEPPCLALIPLQPPYSIMEIEYFWPSLYSPRLSASWSPPRAAGRCPEQPPGMAAIAGGGTVHGK